MWKIILGFLVFAGVAMFVIIKGGDKVDMAGEQHGAGAEHSADSAASAALPGAPASATSPY